jgi:hypothetical protein
MKLSHIALIVIASATTMSAVAAPGRFGWNKNYTPGWSLMTPQERTEWQTKMRGAKTYDECKAMQEEHHKSMEARATEKGITLPAPRQNGCDVMKARGLIK